MFARLLEELGIRSVQSGVSYGPWIDHPGGEEIASLNPSTEEPLARVVGASRADYDLVVDNAQQAFHTWRMTPAPLRGEIVRQVGLALREHKESLGLLVSLEMGKIRAEGEGEVQEMIDMCDFAVGLSRQLYGATMPSERSQHRMFEQWHPLGPVGVITAFNFPVAVWAWNAALAAVCGDTLVWKPSSETPLTAVAVQHIVNEVMRRNGLEGVFCLCIGSGATVGEYLGADRRLPLISATGSCRMGRRLAGAVAARLGRTLLELGGNNAAIVLEGADLDLALRAVVFAAVGTTGQRCTSLRRLILQREIAPAFTQRLIEAYRSVRIGKPWEEGVLMGPLVSRKAAAEMQAALDQVAAQGGKVLYGGKRLKGPGYFVEPAIVQAHAGMTLVQEETFAPILYVLECSTLEEAIDLQNGVDQGLSSALFTDRLRAAETFLSARGSDCGIANVNIGTSGAEIGGAFGGEKDTGGGREAGSDAWKIYMRRQTCTVNWGTALPLAQGIQFGEP